MIPLSQISTGETVYVEDIRGGKAFTQRISDLGFTKGAEVKVLSNSFAGPLMVVIKESRFALGQGEASKIIVKTV